MTSLLVALSCAYVALMEAYLQAWRALPEQEIPLAEPTLSVTVIIPARNEATHIGPCLDAIFSGSYPSNLLEIIVVDDHSEDETAAIAASSFRSSPHHTPAFQLLKLADFVPAGTRLSFKKKAIEVGISHARGEMIVTTDADCLAPKDWLRCLTAHFQHRPDLVLVTAPVAFHLEHNLLQRFQSLDFLGLMGVTGAGIRLGWHHMGNGANLAYRKSAFQAVNGFRGNEQRASGDDMFLIQKMVERYPQGVLFLKNRSATVCTEAKADWPSFFQQRVRWGAKNAALRSWPLRLALFIVFLHCWAIVICAALLLWYAAAEWALLLAFQLTTKAWADRRFLREMCTWFGRSDLLRWIAPSFFLHIGYIAGVGTASLFFKQYEWKGRVVD